MVEENILPPELEKDEGVEVLAFCMSPLAGGQEYVEHLNSFLKYGMFPASLVNLPEDLHVTRIAVDENLNNFQMTLSNGDVSPSLNESEPEYPFLMNAETKLKTIRVCTTVTNWCILSIMFEDSQGNFLHQFRN